MKKFLTPVLAVTILITLSSCVFTQGGAKQKPQIQRDAELEKDSAAGPPRMLYAF